MQKMNRKSVSCFENNCILTTEGEGEGRQNAAAVVTDKRFQWTIEKMDKTEETDKHSIMYVILIQI